MIAENEPLNDGCEEPKLLTVSALAPDARPEITVNNVSDLAGNTIAADSKITAQDGINPTITSVAIDKALAVKDDVVKVSVSVDEKLSAVNGIVLVIRAADRALCQQALEPDGFDKLRRIVDGGAERGESVRAGLQATDQADDIVLVHDAVRPFVSEALIRKVIETAAQRGAAIAAVPVTDTIKEVEEEVVVRTPPRNRLWAAQTPQAFRRDLLIEAYEKLPAGEGATDEAALLERLGRPVYIVQGEQENAKVTTAEDLEEAEWRMTRSREKGEGNG